MIFHSEKDFSKALVCEMKKRDIFHQRIESPSTACGIPDLFCMSSSVPIWLELKVKKGKPNWYKAEHIAWRAGQQRWLFDAMMAGCACFTLVSYDDEIARIEHSVFYENDSVLFSHFKPPISISIRECIMSIEDYVR